MWLPLLLSVSHAADGVDGVLLPGASPVEARLSMGAFAGASYVVGTPHRGLVGAEGSLRITDAIAVFGFVGRAGDYGSDDPMLTTHQVVAVRWLAHASDRFRFAPMLTSAFVYGQPLTGSVGIGAAIEGGGETVRFDLSVPTVIGAAARLREGEYGLELATPTATLFELGLSARINDVHRIRVGLPMISWCVRTEHVYLDLYGSFLLVAGAAGAKVGFRF